jgi:hypothetical protein
LAGTGDGKERTLRILSVMHGILAYTKSIGFGTGFSKKHSFQDHARWIELTGFTESATLSI